MAESMSERLSVLAARYPIDDTLVFGLDIGIASVGSGVVRHTPNNDSIAFAGSRCFEAPEEPKTNVLKNKTRLATAVARQGFLN